MRLSHGGIKGLSRRGQLQTAFDAQEQGLATLFFQQLDLTAHGGLRDAQLFGGERKAHVSSRSLKALEQVEGNPGSPTGIHADSSWLTFLSIVCAQPTAARDFTGRWFPHTS